MELKIEVIKFFFCLGNNEAKDSDVELNEILDLTSYSKLQTFLKAHDS